MVLHVRCCYCSKTTSMLSGKICSLGGGTVLEWESSRDVAWDWQVLASFMFTLWVYLFRILGNNFIRKFVLSFRAMKNYINDNKICSKGRACPSLEVVGFKVLLVVKISFFSRIPYLRQGDFMLLVKRWCLVVASGCLKTLQEHVE